MYKLHPEEGHMKLKDIIKELKKTYSDHDDLDEMISDLDGGGYFDYWADKLSTENFGNNIKLATCLYKIQEESCESSSDYCSLGKSVINHDGLGDNEWAKALFKKAEEIAEDSDDFRCLAEAVLTEEGLSDQEWAKVLFKKAEKVAVDSADLRGLAEAVLTEEGLSDNDWAKSLYEKAIELACSYSELGDVANSIVWSLTDKEWAKKVYQKAIDLCEDNDERNNIIINVKDVLEDESWASSLIVSYGISISSEAVLSASDITLYFETVELNSVDTKDKLKSFLIDFEETAEMEATGYLLAGSITSFETDEGAEIDHEINNNGSLIPDADEDEVTFVWYYSYDEVTYNVHLNELDSPVTLETNSFDEFEVIRSITQDDNELDFEAEEASCSGGNELGIVVNNDGKIQTINLKELHELSAGEDDFTEKKIDLINSLLVRGEANPILVASEDGSPIPDGITCRGCGILSSPGAKFCLECGEKLALECPGCGAVFTQGAKFCGECGTSLIDKEDGSEKAESMADDQLTIASFPGSLGAHKRIFLQPDIPLKKFKNAHSTFLGDCELEEILLFIDNTVMGSGKDGLAITGTRIIEKEIFEDPTFYLLKDIEKIEAKKLKIFINDNEFTDFQMLDKAAVESLCDSLRSALKL